MLHALAAHATGSTFVLDHTPFLRSIGAALPNISLADTAPGSPLELVRVLVDVLLGDGERLAEPQLLVRGVVPDEADRAADLVGAGSEAVAGEEVMRRPDSEVAELDRVAGDDVLHGTAADPPDQRGASQAVATVAGRASCRERV